MILVNKELHEYNLSLVPSWAQKRDPLTPDEVHALIEKEVGKNVVWPSRYYVLLKMYISDDEIDTGEFKLKRTAAYQKQEGYDNRVARILAWGPDAFTDPRVFPNGSPYNIGDWVMFMKYENSFLDINEKQLTYMEDVKLTLNVKDPREICTKHTIGK